jgi:PAS domain S-box-containing protein
MKERATNRGTVSTSHVTGLLAAALGVLVLAGWVMDDPRIKSVIEGAVEMKANTAAGLILSGVALWMLGARRPGFRNAAGQVTALLVVLLGLATLGQFAFGWSLGIDELLFRDTSEFFTTHPGRMSPYSAAAFAATGLGLAALPVRSIRWIALAAGSLTLLIGSYSLIGYLWNASEVITDRFATPVAVHTAVGFVLLGIGTITACRAMDGRAIRRFQELSSIEKRSLAGFVATLGILVIAGGFTYRATVTDAESTAMVVHTQDVRLSLGLLYAAASDAQSYQRSYLLSGDSSYMEECRRHAGVAAREAEKLRLLVADNPVQSRRLAELRVVLKERIDRLYELADTFEKSGLAAAQEMVRGGEGNKLMAGLRSLVGEMDATEATLLATRESEAARDKAKTLVSLLVTLAVAVAGFLILFRGIRREMTSRARAEEELERFFKISLDFLCIASGDGYFKRVSPAVTDILGWSVEEFLATPFIEFVHPDDRAATQREVERQVVGGEKVLRFDNRYRHKDGSWRVLSWRSVPQPGGLMYATARDVTELVRADEALRRSEESLSVTLHSIGDAVLATDTDGRITRMNPVAENLTGWSQADAQGRPIAEVFRIINETTRQPAVIPVASVLETGEIQGLANHTVLIARDGTERPIADSAAPIRARDGTILGVVLVCRDVSRERDSMLALEHERNLLSALMDNMTADIYFKDLDSRFLRTNRFHARRLGLDDPASAVGKTDFDFFSTEHAEEAREDERRVIRTGKPVSKEEKETWPDGRITWAFTVKVPLIDKQGRIAGTFGISHDITEHKESEHAIARLNADLQRQAVQLEAANKELEAFSYSVSHDLRAPLRHVQGYVEMLARDSQDKLSEKSRRFIQTIADAGRDMGELIDDLLSFSRMGRTELNEEIVDLNVLIDEVRGELSASTADRDIRWTVARLPEVHGDRAMLKHMLVNLMGNAVKYTRRMDTAEIEIGFSNDGDGQLAFYVRDNGAGFDMKYADKLFGVFQRLHHADEFEGTGIGLANVRRIIARHGGRTWAEGKPDAGATFYFTLTPAAIDSPSHTRS